MRAVIQRVQYASVEVQGTIISRIDKGLLIFLGIEHEDEDEDVKWLGAKIHNLRIFSDEANKMNRSIDDIGGDLLIVSQFTLHASTKKGNRPSFIKSAKPDQAIPLYELFISELQSKTTGIVRAGEFGADMKIELLNDGPVTILIDSKAKE